MQMLLASLCGELLQFLPDPAVVFIFRKINIISQRLNVKSGASRYNRHMAAAVNTGHGFLRHSLEPGHIELFPGFQHVDQMMRYPIHLFRHDFCRPDVHMAIHLHGIGADDFSVQRPGKFNG